MDFIFLKFCLTPFTLCASRFTRGVDRKGQATVEYLLMLAAVVGVTLIFGVLFHKKILGGMFSLVGMVIGAGRPTTP